MAKLWAGRFEKPTNALLDDFQSSIPFDQRMLECDVTGSIAHATMLGEQGIISMEDAKAIGYTETLYGRRRYIPELKSSNFNIRSGAERIALNTPIQGTAADLIKLAMIRVEKALQAHYPEAKLLLQVHDELIVECPETIAADVAALISREMQQVADLSVPLLAEAKWGKSWYEAK